MTAEYVFTEADETVNINVRICLPSLSVVVAIIMLLNLYTSNSYLIYFLYIILPLQPQVPTSDVMVLFTVVSSLNNIY